MTSSISSLADVELEPDCPVCMEKYKPPVFQCNNGHLICHICERQCPQCPVCREPMPRKKIRNIAFEKMIRRISTIVEVKPCPHQSSGCSFNGIQEVMENHMLDCAFRKKNICSELGFSCNEGISGSTVNDIITHFIFDHNLDGCIGSTNHDLDDVFSTPVSSNSRSDIFEIIFKCKMQELGHYLSSQGWTKPNFIKFDEKMFFVIKRVNSNLKFATVVVCIDASAATAKMYDATIEISSCDNGSQSARLPKTIFKQNVIQLLSKSSQLKFTSEEATSLQYFKIPFAIIQKLCKNPEREFSWKVEISIANKVQTGIRSPTILAPRSNSSSNITAGQGQGQGQVQVPALGPTQGQRQGPVQGLAQGQRPVQGLPQSQRPVQGLAQSQRPVQGLAQGQRQGPVQGVGQGQRRGPVQSQRPGQPQANRNTTPVTPTQAENLEPLLFSSGGRTTSQRSSSTSAFSSNGNGQARVQPRGLGRGQLHSQRQGQVQSQGQGRGRDAGRRRTSPTDDLFLAEDMLTRLADGIPPPISSWNNLLVQHLPQPFINLAASMFPGVSTATSSVSQPGRQRSQSQSQSFSTSRVNNTTTAAQLQSRGRRSSLDLDAFRQGSGLNYLLSSLQESESESDDCDCDDYSDEE